MVCFLEHAQIVQLLIEKGVSVTPSNDLGYLPKDVTNSDLIVNYLENAPSPQPTTPLPPLPATPTTPSRRLSRRISQKPAPQPEVSRSKSVRPNYSTPDRFKLLKELAEESSIVGDDVVKKTTQPPLLDRKKSEGHYFRKGRVKETQQKVLTEEEVVELKKQKEKRQLEVAQLVKKSAVKNNPLFKKLEKRSFTTSALTSPTPSPSTSTNLIEEGGSSSEVVVGERGEEKLTTNGEQEETKPKRNSKVISSLKTKSYVSSSIFVQADEENPAPAPTPIPSVSLTTSPEQEQDMLDSHQQVTKETTDPELGARVTMDYLSGVEETQGSSPIFSNEPSDLEEEEEEGYNNYYTISVQENGQLKVQEQHHLGHTTDEEEEYYYESTAEDVAATNEELVESLGIASPTKTNQHLRLYKGQEEEVEEEEQAERHIYSNNYYDLAINTQNIGNQDDHHYSPSSVLDQTTSSDNEEEEEEEDYSEDEEEEEDDDYEEATPVQFATRLTSPVYKSVVIFNEDGGINKKPQVQEEREKEEGFESTLQEAFFGGTGDSTLDFSPKPEQDLGQLYHSNVSRASDDSGVEVEKHQEEISHEEDVKISSSMVTTTSELVEPSSTSRAPMRPQRSDLRRSSNSSSTHQQETIIIEKTTIPFVLEESKEKKRMSGSQKAAWTMSMSSWAAILDREFNLDEVDQNNKLKQHKKQQEEEQAQQEQKKEVVRQSTASTMDYLGESGKLQIEDSEDDVDFIQHMQEQGGSSRLNLEKISATAPSNLSLSSTLKKRDSSLPQFPTPKRSSSYYHSGSNTLPSLSTTSRPPPPQIGELPRLQSSKSISRKPIAASLSDTALHKKSSSSSPKQYNAPTNQSFIIQVNQRRMTQQGKLYLHVNGIQDILLPLPKERAYVRCVVSDGRFEYMSRYEILAQNINFDYECVIDTHPDMIITISLHVRPDYVMKSKHLPFSRLFSSKKRKESLSGYVNKEDGAIGQARFALAHMLPACTETTYLAGFHCFNAWYSRSFKERHRQKKKNDPDQDVLKVVGNFDVEMLYLSMADYQKVSLSLCAFIVLY